MTTSAKVFGKNIRFRDKHHEHWFLITMFALMISIVIDMTLWLTMRERSVSFPKSMMAMHAATGTTAFLRTKLQGKVESGAYSVDCIWFNYLMAALYFLEFVSSKF